MGYITSNKGGVKLHYEDFVNFVQYSKDVSYECKLMQYYELVAMLFLHVATITPMLLMLVSQMV